MKPVGSLSSDTYHEKHRQGTIHFLHAMQPFKYTPTGRRYVPELIKPIYESLGHPNVTSLFKGDVFVSENLNGEMKVYVDHLIIPNQGKGNLEARIGLHPEMSEFQNISLINNQTSENDVPSELKLLERLKQNFPRMSAVILKNGSFNV
jgi:hypothetical protein